MEPLEHHQFIRAQMRVAGEELDRGEYGARERLLQLCRSLIASLETPIESITRMGWAEPARNADCRTANELLLFDRMKEFEDGMREINVQELADYAPAVTSRERPNQEMVSRMMKHLAAMNVVGESGPDTYFLLPLSRALAEQRYKNLMAFDHDILNRAFNYLPKHLQERQYTYPITPADQPFHQPSEKKLTIFQWQLRADTTAFPDPKFCPEIFERLIEPFDPSRGNILLVGIGQVAHVLRRFKTMIPHHAGKLVLEDIEGNARPRISQEYAIGSYEPFELKFYDIHNPGPFTKGAKVYYMQTVLNWLDDGPSLNFLEQLKQALEPGYSIALIDEIVIPAQDASWPLTAADRLSFLVGAPRKRTEEEYKALIEGAGLKVRKTYRAPLSWSILMELEMLPGARSEAGPEAGPSGQHQ